MDRLKIYRLANAIKRLEPLGLSPITEADIERMRLKVGDSDEASRQAVIDAHDGMENLKRWALIWADHHGIVAMSNDECVVAYCTAVDEGVRIGRKLNG